MRALMVLLTVALVLPHTPPQSPKAERADRIVVQKTTRTMTLYAGDRMLRTYHVALGRGTGAAKHQQGDDETPEGFYTIDSRNDHSAYYRALHISYPNAEDRARAHKLGVQPGADIMIHGLPPRLAWLGSTHTLRNWTQGCIAVTDAEMDEIWKLVPLGTRGRDSPLSYLSLRNSAHEGRGSTRCMKPE